MTAWKAGRLDDTVWHEPPPGSPSRRRWLGRRAPLLAAVALAAGCVVADTTGDHVSSLTACEAVSPVQLAAVLGWEAGPAHPDVPDGDPPAGSTVCNYGPPSVDGPSSVTVFAVVRDAREFYERMQPEPGGGRDIGGPGYRAFVLDPVYTEQPDVMQTFFLLKDGQYVNVLLHHFPPGSAERLARAVAATLP